MLEIFTITAPIFILIGLGFASSLSGLFTRTQIAGMGSFVINFALPALVIKALAEKPIGEVLNSDYLIAYSAGSLLVFAAGLWFSLKVRKESLASSTITALGMSASNSAFIGYPIVFMVVGPIAAVALALNMLIENLIMLPLALALSVTDGEKQNGQSRGTVLWAMATRTAKNPIIISLAIGLGLSISRIPIPSILFKVIDMLALASAPVALFVIGAALYGLRPQGLLLDLAQVSFGKLILHPAAVVAIFLLFPDGDPQMKIAGVLMASAPMMSIYPIVGQRVGLEGRCSAALVCATVISFITISVLVGFVR